MRRRRFASGESDREYLECRYEADSWPEVRYRGIAKHPGRAHVAFGLSNLYRLRGALLGA